MIPMGRRFYSVTPAPAYSYAPAAVYHAPVPCYSAESNHPFILPMSGRKLKFSRAIVGTSIAYW